jgi:hypothetical protein
VKTSTTPDYSKCDEKFSSKWQLAETYGGGMCPSNGDEASLQAEMQFAASMGIEQFVVDAGWWINIDLSDPSNFAQGLGSWQVDPDRFPSGLGALSDYAHQLGMRFGEG